MFSNITSSESSVLRRFFVKKSSIIFFTFSVFFSAKASAADVFIPSQCTEVEANSNFDNSLMTSANSSLSGNRARGWFS